MWLFLLACADPGSLVGIDDSARATDGILDRRMVPTEAPPTGFVLQTPEFTVEPHSEVMLCYFGTYRGPDVGAVYYEWWQDPVFGHHFMTLAVPADSTIPDGTFVDCEDPAVVAMQIPPLLQGTELVDTGHGRMHLPDGVAIALNDGQRWALQTHYVNSTDDTLLVQDAVLIDTIPAAEIVETASTYVANSSQFVLPEGRQQLDVRCEWSVPMNFLNMIGHMHTNGERIQIYHEHPAGRDLLYEIPEWDPSLIYGPKVHGFEEPLAVAQGDVIEVLCQYDNVMGRDLSFPDEMCVAAGIAWPMDQPYQCDVPVVATTW